ncbi:hypothetical protein [Clostridium sp. 001]|nr:hypothetical protein [Clostridium sp. 001]QXE18287.1 hypothetical protein B5S50_05235 [Clostridium sp. 001]
MNSLLGAIVGALVGGGVTYLSQKYFRIIDDEKKEKHYASVLYYDLVSIEDYINNERGSVDIRYFEDWQHIVANCNFLESSDVQVIYRLYDLVYNFDFEFKERKRNSDVRKENIDAYKELKHLLNNKLLENSDTEKFYDYKNMKSKLHKKSI